MGKSVFIKPYSSLFFAISISIHSNLCGKGSCFLNGLFRLHILILSCVLYKSQPSSKKDSPRTSDKLPPTMARQEKSLAVCLEMLQDYTAKDFSLFAVLTTADFYSHNSQFHFLSHNPNDMKQWHATLSCLSSTA